MRGSARAYELDRQLAVLLSEEDASPQASRDASPRPAGRLPSDWAAPALPAGF